MSKIETLRREIVVAGASWATEHRIPVSSLNAAITRYAASATAGVLAGQQDAIGRFLKKDRDAMVTEIEEDVREAIGGSVEAKIEFLLDYGDGRPNPRQFVSWLSGATRHLVAR